MTSYMAIIAGVFPIFHSKLAKHFVPGESITDGEQPLPDSGVAASLSSTCQVNSIRMASKFSVVVMQKMTIS